MPYLVLDVDGWTLEGATTAPTAVVDPSITVLWSASYQNHPEPNLSLATALAVIEPGGDAEGLASRMEQPVSEITIDGSPGFAVEELSPQDGHFIATHVLWDLGSYTVWFTTYEVRLAEAEMLAQHCRAVSELEWRHAADRANAAQTSS